MYNSTVRSPERPSPISPTHSSPQHPYPPPHHAPPLPSLSYPRGQPSSPTRNAPPPMNGYPPHPIDRPAERTPSTFFDPTSEARERKPAWQPSTYRPQSPDLRPQPQYPYPPNHHTQRSYERDHQSPPSNYEPPHSSPYPPIHGHQRHPSDQYPPQSPPMPKTYYSQTMGPPSSTVTKNERPVSSHSTRRSDPMSFSNILSTSDSDPAPRSPPVERKPPVPGLNEHREQDKPFVPGNLPQYELVPPQSQTSIRDEAQPNGVSRRTPPEAIFKTSTTKAGLHARTPTAEKFRPPGDVEPLRPATSLPNKVREIPEKELQAQLARIDAMDHSDVESPSFEAERQDYIMRSTKRMRDVEDEERRKRKRRRLTQVNLYSSRYGEQAINSKENYIQANEHSVWSDIQAQEAADEKERKKVMQRTRRRETTKAKAEQQAADLKERAKNTEDAEEKEKLMKDAQRAEKKASATSKLLNGETPSKDFREVTPLAPNLEGGVMSSFQMTDEAGPEPGKKKGRAGARLKKSKEQKRREKDLAAAAHERGDDLPMIAPKGEPSRLASKRESTSTKDTAHSEKPPQHTSKLYDQMYEQIWRDIARKEIPKVYRIKESSLSTKQSNLRKTAQLAHKEARRWQQKTNKSTKDTQARAKRIMREMLSFWKRNEREERDQRKMAERQELENARKAEADREANRQKRKLNFLISQTELYSHFIGKKVRTDEVEKAGGDVAADVSVSGKTIQDDPTATQVVDLPDTTGKAIAKVTNFEDLDFDNDDETALHEAAMANAQNAVQEAQDRARAFNTDQVQSQFDEGEMNFQNPTSLQNIDIAQPKMLTCQLKEYQLKGLNWLVNLYEQGINGILADEMGLGKTVQSISVMAYLAEQHNIWGPFLVIAPASTLHNWQQEIVRFVPGLKVLPYWGNAKDRKILRKFWDRKHITYRKESPFHVLVTSYQLVVQDTQYFQKIRWQYMVLDEAQAIKSSQSSRWKSLLGFYCRNRLLLTGTPIQNNMQELWALLHFIMPSLFDSHDEFSDWFSKDIESHAQSNTKLNEDQLKRLHMILKPFMLRRIKKHVQKELGDKIEEDVFCDLTYRQRAYYGNLRNKISLLDLIEKAAIGDDQDTATLMNLVMQFRKVCNHPDLFERAEVMSPVQFGYFAETASFLREGHNVEVLYSVRNLIEFSIPRLVGRGSGRLDVPGPDNDSAGWRNQNLYYKMNIWTPANIWQSSKANGAFSWLPFVDQTAREISDSVHKDIFFQAVDLQSRHRSTARLDLLDGDDQPALRSVAGLLEITKNTSPLEVAKDFGEGPMHDLLHISDSAFYNQGINAIEPCCRPTALAPPIELYCASQGVINEKRRTFFNIPIRRTLFGLSEKTEELLLSSNLQPSLYPAANMLPAPVSDKGRYTSIQVPSMRRFVTDSGKLAKLDQLLGQLKEGGHRVLLYFQMTRMIDLMEEYLTYRNYKYCRLDGSTKLEDRRDTVADFQTRSDIFVFLLSTRAGGLGINLTAADTVIFYDSDWNPTIDSQAMDRAHRLGQTRQVTVYRMITRGTIEERIRKRALQKEEVQRVVISGGAGAQVDFNTRSRENRTKDIAMWLADDDQAKEIEKKEAEIAEKEAKEEKMGKKPKKAASKKKLEVSLDDMYHEGEGHFDDSAKPSGAATPIDTSVGPAASGGKKRKGISKKAKTVKEKLAYIDGTA